MDLRVGDAEALDFDDASFDTVACMFSLCAIPDHRRAVAEMVRVLRLGGLLVLADHVTSTNPVLRSGQRLAELVSVPAAGEHFRRRPIDLVTAAGLWVEDHDRFGLWNGSRLARRAEGPVIRRAHGWREAAAFLGRALVPMASPRRPDHPAGP